MPRFCIKPLNIYVPSQLGSGPTGRAPGWNFATNHGQSDRDHYWLQGVKREEGVCQGITVCGGDGAAGRGPELAYG